MDTLSYTFIASVFGRYDTRVAGSQLSHLDFPLSV
jgi:hypothetical protein